MRWADLTTRQIDELDRKTPVILNIAAVEQHGPHLPVDTDVKIGAFFLDRLNQETPSTQLVLPPIAVGCSDHHLDFPGTLSVPHMVFHDYINGVLDSVVGSGFRNIILLNSHGGNQGIGQVITESFGARNPTCRVVLATWWTLIRDELRNLSESSKFGTGHACELETSLMMAMGAVPEDLEIPDGEFNVDTYDWAKSSMLFPAKTTLFRTMKEISGGNGVVGAPQTATAKKGKLIAEMVVSELRCIVEDMKSTP